MNMELMVLTKGRHGSWLVWLVRKCPKRHQEADRESEENAEENGDCEVLRRFEGNIRDR